MEMIQQCKWGLIKWSAGFLSLYLSKRLRTPHTRRPLDIRVIDALMRGLLGHPKLPAFSPEERTRYEAVLNKIGYWHGTGKLQHGKDGGGIVDIMNLLLEEKGLRPFKDIFDVKQGEMESTSVARTRMYARIYGDMHVFGGAPLNQRYGSPRFWSYYFIMASFIHAIGELGLWHPRARKEQKKMWYEQGKRTWTIKVTKRQDGDSMGMFFDAGSDIPNNYPIIIGIERDGHNVLETASYVAQHENRIGSRIPMNAFTHLEVPSAHVAEITKLLQTHGHSNLPVFSFEQCEEWWSQQPFSRLVVGSE